ncbi:odorant receptor Or2-like [Anoplolepis gracilipes]|uniref:odorant receptor Or2-like n=1 Tax=Anoplolepis gracilipes TaxID=354296 RepID=UPI003B9FCB21
MEHPEERYYKLSRFLLSAIGLWPYQNKRNARFKRTAITVIMLSITIVQMMNMFTSNANMDFLIEVGTTIVLTGGFLVQLHTRVIYVDKLKKLFEYMWNDWALEKTDDEMKIMHQYAETTRLLTICSTLLTYICTVGFTSWIFMSKIFGIRQSVNKSHQIIIPVKGYMMYDEERHFYLIQSFLCIIIFLLPLVYLANSSLYVALTQHVCSMCDLLGYRAERLFYVKDTTERDLNCGKIICENITVFVQLHYNVIQFVNMIETCHTIPFLMDLIGTVSGIGLSLIQITIFENTERACIVICLIIIMLGYLMIPNYMGQQVTDMSLSIYEKVYNSAWYDADVSKQKSLLLIMMLRFHPFVVTACKFYPMSLSSFKMIVQLAISYSMFMRHI